jgi:hypothetical protein
MASDRLWLSFFNNKSELNMKFSFLGLIAATFFISCGNGDAANNSATTVTAPVVAADKNYTPPSGIDAKLSASLNPVMDGYLQLKNALTADNSKDAAKAGAAIVAALDKVDTSAMTVEQKSKFNGLAGDIREHAHHIADNSDKIDHQRMHFNMLSEDTYEVAKTFGGGRKLYLAHCPMAQDGKGANWLSEFKEIKNPYFGDQMLECGEVKEELK